MKDDDRDTQKMTPIRPEDVEAPVVRKFQYRTDPGAQHDPDHDLVRGISRARDNREHRGETLGKILDELHDVAPARGPISTAPARPVRIVHKWSMPTWLTIAAIALAVLVLALAVVIASKSKKENAVAATPATTTVPAVASATPMITPVVTAPTTTASVSPVLPIVTATTARTAAPITSAHPTTTAAPTAPTATTEHHDNDIVRTPEL